jgi:hypothetical protein
MDIWRHGILFFFYFFYSFTNNKIKIKKKICSFKKPFTFPPLSLPPRNQHFILLSQSFSQSFRSFLPTSLTQLFLPSARDCSSWVPAADISTVFPPSGYTFQYSTVFKVNQKTTFFPENANTTFSFLQIKPQFVESFYSLFQGFQTCFPLKYLNNNLITNHYFFNWAKLYQVKRSGL